jgi:cation transport ATPase
MAFVQGRRSARVLGKVTALVVDKTGTTEGRPALPGWLRLSQVRKRRPSFAAALERYSEHPLRALSAGRGGRSRQELRILAAPGGGVHGMVDGRPAVLSKRALLEKSGIRNLEG